MELSFYKGKKENLPKIAKKNSIYVTEDTYQMYLSDENNVLHEIDLVDDSETVPTYWTEYWREKTMTSGTWYSKVSSVEFFSELCSLQVGLTYDFVGTIYCSDNIYRQTKSISTSLENDVYEVYCTLSDDTKYVIIHSEESGTTINKIYQISLENDITIHGELYSVLTDCFENESGSIPSGTYYVSSIPSGETELFTMFTTNSISFYEVKHLNNTIVYRGTDTVTAYNNGWTNESYRWLTFTGASCGGKTNVSRWLSCLDKAYKVTFDENGATGTMEDEIVVAGSSYVLPQFTLTAPSGFIFDHYEINGQYYAPGASFIVSGNTTVKCVYSAQEVYVTYDGNLLFTLDISTYGIWEDWADTSINGYAVFRDDEYEVQPYMAEYYIVDPNTGNYVSPADTIISGRQYELVETEEYSNTHRAILAGGGQRYSFHNNTNPYGITARSKLYGDLVEDSVVTATIIRDGKTYIVDELMIYSPNNADLQGVEGYYEGELIFEEDSSSEVNIIFSSGTYASTLFIKAFNGIFSYEGGDTAVISAGNYRLLSLPTSKDGWAEQYITGSIYGGVGNGGDEFNHSLLPFDEVVHNYDAELCFKCDQTDIANYYAMSGGIVSYTAIQIDYAQIVSSAFKNWWDNSTVTVSHAQLSVIPVGKYLFDAVYVGIDPSPVSSDIWYFGAGISGWSVWNSPWDDDTSNDAIFEDIKYMTIESGGYTPIVTVTDYFNQTDTAGGDIDGNGATLTINSTAYVTYELYEAFMKCFIRQRTFVGNNYYVTSMQLTGTTTNDTVRLYEGESGDTVAVGYVKTDSDDIAFDTIEICPHSDMAEPLGLEFYRDGTLVYSGGCDGEGVTVHMYDCYIDNGSVFDNILDIQMDVLPAGDYYFTTDKIVTMPGPNYFDEGTSISNLNGNISVLSFIGYHLVPIHKDIDSAEKPLASLSLYTDSPDGPYLIVDFETTDGNTYSHEFYDNSEDDPYFMRKGNIFRVNTSIEVPAYFKYLFTHFCTSYPT